MFGYVNDYLEAGWEVPIPLPPGKKYPPKAGMTGRIARVTKNGVGNARMHALYAAKWRVRLSVRTACVGIEWGADHYGSKRCGACLDAAVGEPGHVDFHTLSRPPGGGSETPAGHMGCKARY